MPCYDAKQYQAFVSIFIASSLSPTGSISSIIFTPLKPASLSFLNSPATSAETPSFLTLSTRACTYLRFSSYHSATFISSFSKPSIPLHALSAVSLFSLAAMVLDGASSFDSAVAMRRRIYSSLRRRRRRQ